MDRVGWWGALLLLGFGRAYGQAATTVDALLPQLQAYAQQYESSIPSLSCDELITSQVVKNGRVKKEMKIESTLREIRTEGGRDPYQEKHQFRTVDGQPAQKKFDIPFFVQGGFANSMGFRHPEWNGCFDYQLTQGEDGKTLTLKLALREGSADPVCRALPEGYRKTVVVERASGRVMFVERSISARAAKEKREAFYASMEYAPQTIGDETMWLPKKLVTHDAKDEGGMTVVFSNYHRYVGKATLLPGEPVE